jgi:hypothetical protein
LITIWNSSRANVCTASRKASLHTSEFRLIFLKALRNLDDEVNLSLPYDSYVPVATPNESPEALLSTDYPAKTYPNTNSVLEVDRVFDSTLDAAFENEICHSASSPPIHYHSNNETSHMPNGSFSSGNLSNLLRPVYTPRLPSHQPEEITFLNFLDINNFASMTSQSEGSLPWYLCFCQSPFRY